MRSFGPWMPRRVVGAEAAGHEAVGDDAEIPEVVGVGEAGDHPGHHDRRARRAARLPRSIARKRSVSTGDGSLSKLEQESQG